MSALLRRVRGLFVTDSPKSFEELIRTKTWNNTLNFLTRCLVSPQTTSMGFNLVIPGNFPFGEILPPQPTIVYRKYPSAEHKAEPEGDSSKLRARRRPERLRRSKSHSCDLSESDEKPLPEGEVSYFFGLMPPHQATFPVVDFDISTLFYSLSIVNIISIFECILGESKIVFLSTKAKLLTHVIQSFLTLIWPFSWVWPPLTTVI